MIDDIIKILVPVHQLKITWYTEDGCVLSEDAYADASRSWLFKVEGPGVISDQVKFVEYPLLSYADNKPEIPSAIVHMYRYEITQVGV